MKRQLKIGIHRNSPRLWIEGALLDKLKGKRGQKYQLIKHDNIFYLTLAIDSMPGDVVRVGHLSGRDRRRANGTVRTILIVDLHSKELREGLINVEYIEDQNHLKITSA